MRTYKRTSSLTYNTVFDELIESYPEYNPTLVESYNTDFTLILNDEKSQCPKLNMIKIEQETMKANFIHFWCVDSEFIIKNKFHNWTSELGCIWHIFGKLGYFWLFLANPDTQVTVNITVNKAQFFCNSWLLPVLKCLKRAKFSKNVPNAP